MPPKKLQEILEHVAPSRRDFLKRAIGGTLFAVPLVASFPMDGLGLQDAYGLNGVLVCNQSCSNQTYTGPTKFEADLVGPGPVSGKGHAHVIVNSNGDVVAIRFTIALKIQGSKNPPTLLMTACDCQTAVPAIEVTFVDLGIRVFLSLVGTRLEEGVLATCLSDVAAELEDNDVPITVRTKQGDASGVFLPS